MPLIKAARFAFALSFLAGFAVTIRPVPVQAQLPQARITAVFPPGAQAGQTLDVQVLNGTDLDELTALHFSHPGIKATLKSGNTFTVAVDGNVPPGVYEAAVQGLYGVSNPRCYVVGTLPEVAENDANNTPEQAQAIEAGQVINGRSNGGADVDHYKFTGKKGQRILVECAALQIDSRFQGELQLYFAGRRLGRAMARLNRVDPVLDVTLPEDGEYIIRVTDFVYAGGAEHNYRLTLHTGPHVDFIEPPAGVPGTTAKYTLFGRNLPGAQPADLIASDGRRLEKLEVEIALPAEADQLTTVFPASSREAGTDGFAYVLNTPAGRSNPVLIAFAPRSLIREVEPNDTGAQAQKITTPIELYGQFQKRSDIDVYEFEAKAGQVFWIEAFAQRIGTFADPSFNIDRIAKNQDGTEAVSRIATLDDDAVAAIPNLLDTTSDDAAYRFQSPADGTYRISIRDRFFESRGTPDLQYHLAIREESWDFRLAVIPPAPLQNAQQGYQTWSLSLRKGENLSVEVAALRRHGFKGAIDITAENLPAGVTCYGATINESANSATLVFSAAENAQPVTQEVRIIGTSRVDSPAALVAVATSEQALKASTDALPGLDQNLTKTMPPLQQAEQARKKAEEVAAADAAAAKTAEQTKATADKALTDAQATVKTATDAKAAADKSLADSKTASTAAEAALKAAQAELDKDKENAGLKEKVAAAQTAQTTAAAAVTAADAAAKDAAAKLQAATTAQQQAQQQATQAAQALTQASNKAKASDEALKREVAKHEQALAQFTAADNAKKAGVAAVAKAQADLTAARQAADQAARNVRHAARPATLTWNGTQQAPGVARLSRMLMLSVMNEVAQYQIVADPVRETLSHSRTLLVPVRLLKRNGYNQKITLTPQAVPKNVQIQADAIDAGKDSGLIKVTVPNNVDEGTWTFYLQAQGQVPYQKNLPRLERAKAAQAAVDAELAQAGTAAKAATDAVTAATQQVTATTEAAKKAQAGLDAAKKTLTTAQQSEKTATDAEAGAVKVAQDAQQKVTAAEQALNQAKEAAAKDAANQDLAKAVTAAEKAKADADAALKTAQDAQKTAETKRLEAQAATKLATDGEAAATKTLADAQTAATAAGEAKKKADTDKAAADAKVKEVTARKQAADNELKAATDYSKVNNLNTFPPSTPITITVRKGAFTLAVAPAGGGNVKKGATVEVKVTVTRMNGFTGPVNVNLALPPGVTGLSAPQVTVPEGMNEATLVVTAADDAPEGAVANLFVRGTADWNGPASADGAVGITVAK